MDRTERGGLVTEADRERMNGAVCVLSTLEPDGYPHSIPVRVRFDGPGLEFGGVVIYLRQEGRGIGLYNKIDAYQLQDAGADTFEANHLLGRGADERDYLVAAQMLRVLDLTRIRLLTNNPDKQRALEQHGIEVVAAQPTNVYLTSANKGYLTAKMVKASHRINMDK